jgi:EAL domain-containing protein (putative c-di-GMP-specific phosphodiesterase class I)
VSTPTAAAISSPLAALRTERDRFVALAFCWADILLEANTDGRIVYAAGALQPFTGIGTDQAIGQPLDQLFPPAERTLLRELLANARKRERSDQAMIRLTGPSGVSPQFRFSGYQLQDLNGHFFIALRHGEAAARSSRFGRRSRDECTGLQDADSFIDMVTGQLATVSDNAERQMSLIVLLGYEDLRQRLIDSAERELLAAIGGRLGESSIDGESAARLGTDRYAVIHAADFDIDRVKDDIADLTRQSDPAGQGTAVDTATVNFDTDGVRTEDLARGVIYALKRFCNSRGSSFPLERLASDLSTLAGEATEEIERLKRVITNADFEMAFQPVLNARSGSVLYYETLLRIPAQYGIASPYERLSFAEEIGLITAFDLAMVRKLVGWLEKNTARNTKTHFALNISATSLGSLSFQAQLDRLVKQHPWLAGRLLIEITKSAGMENVKTADNFIQNLRQQGFRIALDDFGAGFADFQSLAGLDVDVVKLDGTAVHEAMRARTGKAFFRAMIAFCRELGIATVAEMVEDEASLAFVRDCGVQFVQGFLFGKPLADLRAVNSSIPYHVFPDRIRVSGRAEG